MPTRERSVIAALCRLYYREADWDGGWWGTRPDRVGPYYKNAEWEGTESLKSAPLSPGTRK